MAMLPQLPVLVGSDAPHPYQTDGSFINTFDFVTSAVAFLMDREEKDGASHSDNAGVRVSIIIPVYNGRRTLGRALKSAMEQTVDKEVIVIDDCSTDGSDRVIGRFSDRVVAIRNEANIGPGPSRNRGIMQAKGRYVAFLDADDVLPDRSSLERMASLCDASGLRICGSLRESRFRMRTVKEGMYREECGDGEGCCLDYKDTQVDYDYTNYIFDRGFLVENGILFPDLRRYQDVPFLVNAMIHAGRYCVAPVTGYRYSMRSKPLAFDERMVSDLLKGMLMVLGMAEDNGLDQLRDRTMMRLRDQYTAQLEQAAESDSPEIEALLGCLIQRYGFSSPVLEGTGIDYVGIYGESLKDADRSLLWTWLIKLYR